MSTGGQSANKFHGNPFPATTKFKIDKIGSVILGNYIVIAPAPLPEDDPRRRCPDISFVRSRTTWHPCVSLESGLLKTIGYLRDKSKC